MACCVGPSEKVVVVYVLPVTKCFALQRNAINLREPEEDCPCFLFYDEDILSFIII